MTHTTRLKARAIDLDEVFTAPNMERVWKQVVRQGLRNQEILDLHDHLDFHRNLHAHLEAIRQEVIEGSYRPRRPLIARVEKSSGIPRRLQTPAPEDATVLQTLVEVIAPKIEAKQPSKSSYYSRSHGQPKSVLEIDQSFPYPWWQLWPAFQTRIYEFTRGFDYVVVTDVANYFDSIPLAQLRNTLAAMAEFKESLLDFLFYMLEAFVWRPDYLPSSGVGLPQIQFDAPRLLGHAFLFELDALLQKRTGGNFVRWMDDIDIGVPSMSEARRLLGDVDELLCTRGVRLNSGKTKIMDARVATKHFWLQENRRLTILDGLIKSRLERGASPSKEAKQLKTYFKLFWGRRHEGTWDKVLKRYYTLAGRLSDPFMAPFTSTVLRDLPGLRTTVFRYYQELGYSWRRFNQIEEYLTSDYCLDDSSLFQAALLLVNWSLPWNKPAHRRCVALAKHLSERSECGLIAAFWLIGKYGSRSETVSLLQSTQHRWCRSATLTRQAAALLPRLFRSLTDYKWLSDSIMATGSSDGLRVVTHCQQLHSLDHLDSSLRGYLLPSTVSHKHSLPKVLIAITMLNGNLPETQRKQLFSELMNRVAGDEVYTRRLRGALQIPTPSNTKMTVVRNPIG